MVSMTGQLVVNTMNPALLPGIILTFTPHLNTRILAFLYVNLFESTIGTDELEIDLLLDGSPTGKILIAIPNLAVRIPVNRTFAPFDLAGLTTHTLAAQALLQTSTGTAWTILGATLVVSGMPNLHS